MVPAPTPEPKPSTAQPRQDVVVPPVRTRTVEPVYPAIARASGMEGDVVVQAVVQPDGRVTDVKVVRSANELLNTAAIQAVRQYVYQPGLRNGVAEAFQVEITVKFSLTP